MSGDTILNGRYSLVAQQGSGGMAVIYKAIDQALGRTVAVKILRPSLTAEPSFITRFQNEARSIANLTHPNIVTVFDVGNDGAANFIVMEFVDGQDLKKIIRAHGALPIERVLNIGIGICAGLGFAHRAGIVHADVKPQNVLMTKDDVVKITDFGIAQALSDTQPTQRQSVVWGSPHSFAPEQAQGERPTAASDVYSIGIVLFEMLTGRLPFTGANQQELAMAHIKDRIPSPKEFNPAVSDSIASIVMKAMSKSPNDRYRTADQIGQLLVSYRDRGRGYTVVQEAAPKPEPEQPKPITPPPPREQPSQQPESPGLRPSPVTGYPRPQPNYDSVVPTQRYSSAPNAPGQFTPQSQPGSGRYTPSQPNIPQPAQAQGDSRSFQPHPYNRSIPSTEPTFSLDGVTIALALLAFMAVACLIPLYIAVLQARLG